MGVVAFTLVVGTYPFRQAVPTDGLYYQLYSSEPMRLWELHGGTKRLYKKGALSEDFTDFIMRSLKPDPAERMTLEEMKAHPWLSALQKQEEQQDEFLDFSAL